MRQADSLNDTHLNHADSSENLQSRSLILQSVVTNKIVLTNGKSTSQRNPWYRDQYLWQCS